MSEKARETAQQFDLRPVPCPPPMMDDYVKLVYPTGHAPLDVLAVGQTVKGFLTHWSEGRAVPCLHQPVPCSFCSYGWQPRWYGYLACVLDRTFRRRVAVISEGAYRNCPGLVSRDGKLRGLAIRLQRMGEGKNAPIKAIIGEPIRKVELPEEWDLVGSLCRVWGLNPTEFRSRIPGVKDDFVKEEKEPVGQRRKRGSRG